MKQDKQKLTPAEKNQQWILNRKASGWRALSMVVPPELAAELLRVKHEFKLKHPEYYRRY